jgi:tetratricopeptide (TPR) repeat protein
MPSPLPYPKLVDAARRRGFVDPEVSDARDAVRLLWARAEAGRREVRGTKAKRRDVADALLDPLHTAPSVEALKAWAEGPPADPSLLTPRPPAWPHAGLVLGPMLRSLKRSPSFAGWLRASRWALELGHADVARRWAAHAARRVEGRVEAAQVTELQAEIRLVSGELDTAERLARRALETWPAADAEPRARTQGVLAKILAARGRTSDAADYLQSALRSLLRVHHGGHRWIAEAQVELADVRLGRGEADLAQPLLDDAMATYTALNLGEHAAMARLLQVHGQLLQHLEQLSVAHASVQAGRRIQQRLWATELHPAAATTRHLLGGIAHALGRHEEARRCFEDNRRILDDLFPPGPHPLRAATLHQLAALQQAGGELGEAALLLRDALDQEVALFGGREHPSTAVTELSLGLVLIRQGRRDEGLALLGHAAVVLESTLGADHPHTRHAVQLLKAATGDAEDEERPNIVTPFVLHALSAAGRSVSRERLARLAFRQLLHERATSLLPVLQAADLASARPGTLCTDPESLPLPPELGDRLQVPWPQLIEPVVEMHRQFTEGFEALFPATRGRIDPRGMDLNPLEDADCAALVDDALSEAVAARKTGDASALRDELELWVHAARIAIRMAPTTLGTALPRLLLQQLPQSREVLMERWSDELSPEHRARLG